MRCRRKMGTAFRLLWSGEEDFVWCPEDRDNMRTTCEEQSFAPHNFIQFCLLFSAVVPRRRKNTLVPVFTHFPGRQPMAWLIFRSNTSFTGLVKICCSSYLPVNHFCHLFLVPFHQHHLFELFPNSYSCLLGIVFFCHSGTGCSDHAIDFAMPHQIA